MTKMLMEVMVKMQQIKRKNKKRMKPKNKD